MEDYIFLIIAIVIAIFGAINKNVKKKLAENAPGSERVKSPNYFMEQWFADDSIPEPVGKKNPPATVKPAAAYVAEKISNNVPKQKYYHQPFKSSLPDRPKHETISAFKKPVEVEQPAEAEETFSYLEDFSLRKAVVYSIILEKKY